MGAITLLDRTEQVPGETADVRIKLLDPEIFGDSLVVGAHFEIREVDKPLGRGTVLQICD
jgi:hypothetical protein